MIENLQFQILLQTPNPWNRSQDDYSEFISRDYYGQIRETKSAANIEPWKGKLMMFADNEEIPKYQKEELKEEVEEEKEFLQEENIIEPEDHDSSQNQYEDDDIIENDDNDQEMEEIPIDDRIAASTANQRTNRDNIIQNRAEILSTVENLSNTVPWIQIENEFQQNTAAANERRILNQLIGQGSIDDSDFDDADEARINSGNSLEEQIEIIMANFMSTVTSERNQISELK